MWITNSKRIAAQAPLVEVERGENARLERDGCRQRWIVALSQRRRGRGGREVPPQIAQVDAFRALVQVENERVAVEAWATRWERRQVRA